MDQTIPARFERQADALSRQPLFWSKRDGAYRPITWQQAAADVHAFARFLLVQQINPGDRVLLLSESRPEWGIADVAIQSVGAWTVPIYPSLTPSDIEVICRDCHPMLAIASTVDQARKLLEVFQKLPSPRGLVVLDSFPDAPPGCLAWSRALAQGREADGVVQALAAKRLAAVRPEDTATLIYTSGTTGEPKGVMLSHRNFLSNVDACLQVIPITGRDLHLSFLPLCHVFERMAGWYLMLTAGAAVAYAENMDTIPENMAEIHPTVMLGVPRFFEKLYGRIQEGVRQAPPLKRRLALWAMGVGRRVAAAQAARQRLPLGLAFQRTLAESLVFKKLKARLGGRLRFFVSGGAPLSKEIGEFFYGMGVTIIEGYGLTETSPVIAVNRVAAPRFGSVGPMVPGVEVRIAEDGEIVTRGPHIMQGYYNKPDATSVVLAGGWFHTGDIGHLDPEGCLHVTDRKKDLIKTAGGKFIAPQKLENLFVTDPSISQAFVFGDRKPYCVALIVPNFEQLRRIAQEQEVGAASVQELVRHPRVIEWYFQRVQLKQAHLPTFEQIKKIALLDQEFSQASGELTPTLKAKRSIIAARYDALLRGLYENGG
ncbi:MAG: hypothetical protein COV75_03260 [Candidatus Omnitrophica bacterium CG11_big_fil_rev_8_21_14_0_20_63_9]|nr:MAG: hypothetical protein COV75_03260 [Candidatus Omnitrophica bacterium CG11_big_fil_rev_8_21_14_0_20_63_9]